MSDGNAFPLFSFAFLGLLFSEKPLAKSLFKRERQRDTMKDNALSTDRVVKTCLIITLIQHHLLPTSTSRIFLSPLSSANLSTLSFFFFYYVIQLYYRIISTCNDIKHSFQIESLEGIWNELKITNKLLELHKFRSIRGFYYKIVNTIFLPIFNENFSR